MSVFSEVDFHGTFRSYQQRVLNRFEEYAKDKKVHIVAAPGSGKTILGLELVRRLGTSALILSPTVVVQHQWGERFRELFLTSSQSINDYITEDLSTPKPITSLTYQGFYSAWTGKQANSLLKYMRENKIHTLCLDEAHHLKRNWHSALEDMLCQLSSEITVVSLTATPPSDSSPAEWGRYLSLCGEIDEEITIPELVADGTLCPHQDFLFFSHPTDLEMVLVKEYQHRVEQCLKAILESTLVDELLSQAGILPFQEANEFWILENTRGISALLSLAHKKGIVISKELKKEFSYNSKIPSLSLEIAERALQFVLDNPTAFSEELNNRLRQQLTDCQLIIREKVSLTTTEEITKALKISSGKLEGIGMIAKKEQENLKKSLRLLVLTDFIDQEQFSVIGSNAPISQLGAVPVFEMIRRSVDALTPLSILTGSLVVLPYSTLLIAEEKAGRLGISFTSQPIGNSSYYKIQLGGQNREKVALVTQLFQEGLLHGIIGTKALLGEGWDSPCINSVIIASVVGSYVLSNQMRGRAIRKDSASPSKVANIWHLVTTLPYGDSRYDPADVMYSDDYTVMTRRFDAFLAPTYNGMQIENGIQRIDGIRPPYNKEGIATINHYMAEQSSNRSKTAASWDTKIKYAGGIEVINVTEVPYTKAPPHFLFTNVLRLSTFTAVMAVIVAILGQFTLLANNISEYILIGLGGIILMNVAFRVYKSLLKKLSPKKYIQQLATSLLNTLIELKEITSKDVSLYFQSDPLGAKIDCALSGGTYQEKKLFSVALSEMLSPFDSPRYLIYGKQKTSAKKPFQYSFSCPSVIANHRKRVDAFQQVLSKQVSPFQISYTGSPEGRAILLQCLKYSYINRNADYIKQKRIVKQAVSAEKSVASVRQQIWSSFSGFFKGILFRGLSK